MIGLRREGTPELRDSRGGRPSFSSDSSPDSISIVFAAFRLAAAARISDVLIARFSLSLFWVLLKIVKRQHKEVKCATRSYASEKNFCSGRFCLTGTGASR